MLYPPILFHMVQIDIAAGIRIPVRSSKDAPPSKLQSILHIEVVMILRVQHAIRKRLPRSHTKEIARQPCPLGVDVVECWTFLWSNASAHGAHAETHSFVAVDEVGEDLGGGRDGDAAFVAELVEAALHA